MWSRGFELAYATTAGEQIRVPLVDAWSLRVGVGCACSPVQLVSRATLSGRWWSATDGRHVGSQSWLERDLMLLDFDPTVIAIGSQPFWLRWSEGSGRPVARRRHRDRAPCHADVVQPVGVAIIDSRERPAAAVPASLASPSAAVAPGSHDPCPTVFATRYGPAMLMHSRSGRVRTKRG
jgi:hypothetical protein